MSGVESLFKKTLYTASCVAAIAYTNALWLVAGIEVL